MDNRKLLKTLQEANKYPLALRIAARLHRDGQTSSQMHAAFFQTAMFQSVPSHLVNQVYNYMRDIENGTVKMDFDLMRLTDDFR